MNRYKPAMIFDQFDRNFTVRPYSSLGCSCGTVIASIPTQGERHNKGERHEG
jgi:hypothetical protein